MSVSSVYWRFVLLCSMVFSAAAFAAPAADPVKVGLQAFKVVLTGGKESLVESKTAKPGETLEYRATYTNTGKKAVTNLAATLPVPQGMEYVALSSQPSSALKSREATKLTSALMMGVPSATSRALRRRIPRPALEGGGPAAGQVLCGERPCARGGRGGRQEQLSFQAPASRGEALLAGFPQGVRSSTVGEGRHDFAAWYRGRTPTVF